MPDAVHPIPLAALDSPVAIIGRTGSGKTFTARGLAERLLDDGRQMVAIDPTGVWHGLRTAADGKAAGYGVPIFGGDHGDVPLLAGSGAQLAELLVDRRLSAVIDTSLLHMGERHRFYAPFLARLHHANRAALHLLLDEADELGPQSPQPDAGATLHELERIVRRGRVRGFRPVLITQRPAVLSKNLLSQAGCIVAMNLTAKQDRAAVMAWIEGQADVADAKALIASLPQLRTGEGWVWWPAGGPARRVQFPSIRTFDSGRTPEHGTLPPAPISLAGLDVQALREALAAPTPEAAAKEAPPSAAALQAAEAKGYARGLAEGRADAREQRRELLEAIRRAAAYLAPLAVQDGVLDVERVPAVVIEGNAEVPATPVRLPAPEASRPQARQVRGTGAELRVLRVLAQRHPARLTIAQWATLARLSRRGGTWGTYVSRLRVAGLIEEGGGTVGVTPEGLATADVVPAEPASAAEVLADWKRAVGSGAGRMLDALLAAGSAGMDRANLADRCNMAATGGTFGTYLSRLRTNGLIVERGRRVQLVAELLDA